MLPFTSPSPAALLSTVLLGLSQVTPVVSTWWKVPSIGGGSLRIHTPEFIAQCTGVNITWDGDYGPWYLSVVKDSDIFREPYIDLGTHSGQFLYWNAALPAGKKIRLRIIDGDNALSITDPIVIRPSGNSACLHHKTSIKPQSTNGADLVSSVSYLTPGTPIVNPTPTTTLGGATRTVCVIRSASPTTPLPTYTTDLYTTDVYATATTDLYATDTSITDLLPTDTVVGTITTDVVLPTTTDTGLGAVETTTDTGLGSVETTTDAGLPVETTTDTGVATETTATDTAVAVETTTDTSLAVDTTATDTAIAVETTIDTGLAVETTTDTAIAVETTTDTTFATTTPEVTLPTITDTAIATTETGYYTTDTAYTDTAYTTALPTPTYDGVTVYCDEVVYEDPAAITTAIPEDTYTTTAVDSATPTDSVTSSAFTESITVSSASSTSDSLSASASASTSLDVLNLAAQKASSAPKSIGSGMTYLFVVLGAMWYLA